MKYPNPFAFRPWPVTLWTTVVYLALVIPLIWVQENVPSVPSHGSLPRGVNLSEAWQDLQTITKGYHPFNSHQNDVVRQYLINRSKDILNRNGVAYTYSKGGGPRLNDNDLSSHVEGHAEASAGPGGITIPVTLFDDQIANVTFSTDRIDLGVGAGSSGTMGVHYQGNNFYIYIRGKEDPEGSWWLEPEATQLTREHGGGVLVNCHFDSVSTGYGATDDGMSCVSLLQLLSHFSSGGKQPKHGIILLFNNAEEDGLLGARAFSYSPLRRFIHTFVNLEGAGAGGRAMMFRATDMQVAKAYSLSPHPFGSVVAADAFKQQVLGSGTDYAVFSDVFGHRGIDIAFYEERARYHTEEDDARHTSVASIWHMLSAALASTQRLSDVTASQFSGPRSDGRDDLVQNGKPADGVYFDWFGRSWTVFTLRSLFAWSVTLLVVTPLMLAAVAYILIRQDRFYFFAKHVKAESDFGDEFIALGGWRGLVRFPIAAVVSVALTCLAVYLVARFNPLIMYSSRYSVWAMTLSALYVVFWAIMHGFSTFRPSALHRGYAIMGLFAVSWVALLGTAIAEDKMRIGAFYFAAFFHTFVFLALLVSMLELFALPKKQDFANELHQAGQGLGIPRHSTDADHDNLVDAPTETTPLRASEQGYAASDPRAFSAPFDREQPWSGRLPKWTWAIQFLLLAPIHVILVGNLGLMEASAMAMTAVDGTPVSAPLIGLAFFGILLILPLTPFMHRITFHVPLFLLLVFAGTFIYNLAAFPFSDTSRFKFMFKEVVDIDNSTNTVTLTGHKDFMQPVLGSLPTTAGQNTTCHDIPGTSLTRCQYDASSMAPDLAEGANIDDLVTVTASKSANSSAVVTVDALNTRTCTLVFSSPVFGFQVQGGVERTDAFGRMPGDGISTIQLWRRTWHGAWNVTVDLTKSPNGSDESSPGHTGSDLVSSTELKFGRATAVQEEHPLNVTVVCEWADANEAETIPAYHELLEYMPTWATVTMGGFGLVGVAKTYEVR